MRRSGGITDPPVRPGYSGHPARPLASDTTSRASLAGLDLGKGCGGCNGQKRHLPPEYRDLIIPLLDIIHKNTPQIGTTGNR